MTEPHRLTLLTQEDCEFCDHAKAVLARVAEDHPLRIDEISLTSDIGRRLAMQSGFLFAPGLLVDGEPFTFGRLSERKLRKLLLKA